MLSRTEITNLADKFGQKAVVFGNNNIDAEIAVVLEYPAEHDTRTGIALSGNAGKFIFNELTKYGIDYKNCYTTCAVKRKVNTFSEEFTKISNTELLNWQTVLEKELASLPNLKYILMVGKYGLQLLTGEDKIMDWRGSVYQNLPSPVLHHCKAMAIFNPVTIFREPKWEVIEKFDLHKFSLVVLDKFTPMKVQCIINPTYQEAMRWIYKMDIENQPISVDIEISHNETACIGLSNKVDVGMCINFRTNTGNHYTLQEEKQIRKALFKLFTKPTVQLVLQNGSFDTTWLGYKDRAPLIKPYFDTLLAHHTLYPRLPHNLGFLTSVYSNHPYYKDEGKTWKEGMNINQYWEYNVKDVCITLQAYKGLLRELQTQKLDTFFFGHVMRLQPHLVNMCIQGVKVDTVLKEHIRAELSVELDEQKAKFQKLAQEYTGMSVPINMNSPREMGILVYDIMKLPNYHDKRKTDEETFVKLLTLPMVTEEQRQILKVYMEYKKSMKFYSTYIDNKIDPDGRMRCEYKQYGVQNAPGRLSSSSVFWGSWGNLQNQPQKAQNMFVADKGYKFIYFDLKQAEAKVVAYGWQVKKLIAAFEECAKDPNKDVHRMNASNIFKLPYDQIPSFDRYTLGKTTDDPKKDAEITLRYLGKRCVHGLNYRMQVDRLAQTTGISLDMAREAYNNYHATYPEIQQAWKNTITELKTTKQLFNYMGRRLYFLEQITDNNLDSVIAFKPQSTIGDYVSSIIYDVEEDPEFPAEKARCILNIHDALIFLVHDDVIDVMLKLVHKYANKPIKIHEQDVVIGMDFKVSTPDSQGWNRWSTLKNYDYKEGETYAEHMAAMS